MFTFLSASCQVVYTSLRPHEILPWLRMCRVCATRPLQPVAFGLRSACFSTRVRGWQKPQYTFVAAMSTKEAINLLMKINCCCLNFQ